MEPFATGGTRLLRGYRYELRSDSSMAGPFCHDHVDDEGVDEPIPRNVHEADELGALPRGDPAQAPALNLLESAVLEEIVPEGLGVQPVDLVIGEGPAPLQFNAHRSSLSVAPSRDRRRRRRCHIRPAEPQSERASWLTAHGTDGLPAIRLGHR